MTFEIYTLLFVITASLAGCFCLAKPWLLTGNYKSLPRTSDSSENSSKNIEFPSLTVIVYDFFHQGTLPAYMESLMAQDYPNFNVVLVCQATSAAASEVSELFAGRWTDRLHITFVPTQSHNLSRRKLAYTLGIKASSADYVLTTTSNCIIPSEKWLSLMMEPVISSRSLPEKSKKEIVLGVSHMNFSELYGASKWFKQFDSLCTKCQWLSAAISSHPYRGDGHNLLFNRQLFLKQKGYGAIIHLENGDDDLFINSIATAKNTAVQLHPESQIITTWGKSSSRIWGDLKERYEFTQRWLPKKPFLQLHAGLAFQWLGFIGMIVAFLPTISFSLGSLVIPVAGFLAVGLSWLIEIVCYRKAAKQLGAVRLWWALPWFILFKPINSVLFRLSRHHNRIKNFTWQRKK